MQIPDEFGNDEVEVGVALAVRVRRHIDRHVIDFQREIRAVVQIEGAQEVLVGFPFAGMLSNDQPGDVFQYRCGAQERLTLQLSLADVAGGGGPSCC